MSPTPTQSPLASPASTVGTRRGKTFVPLTSHGMPKAPKSPGGSIRPHRFSFMGSPRSPMAASPPMTPMLLASPRSPPMSAKSFGTFIDSEPSTPAYSPQARAGWDSSTLMLLSPVSSAPSSPAEPQWEMVTPLRKPSNTSTKQKKISSLGKEISIETSLSSHPITPLREEHQKENLPPTASETAEEEEKEGKSAEEQPQAAPLEKLATRMKSILRRKTTSDRKAEKKIEKKKRNYQELDHMEDVHWTEM